MVSSDGGVQSEIEARIKDASKIMRGKQGEGAGLYLAEESWLGELS